MYKNFWHEYLQQHAAHNAGTTITVNPAALFAVTLCLFVLACWAAHQIQSRCGGCGAWPVRCRCTRERARR
jgi:hypothetical protein